MLNPIIRRELITSLRNWKAYMSIMIYVLILAIVSAVSIASISSSYYGYSGFDPQSITQLYAVLTGFQFVTVLIIVPALTSGSISGERERQTLNLMLITKMSTFQIAVGKLLSSLAVVVLMILAAMPVFAIIFYYGGISLFELISMSLYTIISAAAMGSICIFISSVLKRTITATVLSYIIILVLCAGTFIIGVFGYGIISTFRYSYIGGATNTLLDVYNALNAALNMDVIVIGFVAVFMFNPFMGFLSVIDSQLGTGVIYDAFYSISYNSLYSHSYNVKLWIFNIIASVGIIALMLFLTASVLKPVKPSRRRK